MRTVDDRALLAALTSGGDERILIDPATGANRYHLNPLEFATLLQRGSCTAGALNTQSYRLAKEFLATYDDVDYEALVEEQAARLRQLVQPTTNDPVDVFFGPSGTDLVYYPLMFRRMLQSETPVVHIVSCPEELGSGSALAAAGRFYGHRNQFGDSIEPGALVCPATEPAVFSLSARSQSGEILERREELNRIIHEHPDHALIGSLVYGSKSGIEDDLAAIGDNPSEVLWVVDLCQFRVVPELIDGLLDQGAMVMLTGSKFFQAPPFAAALLVPRVWTEQLRDAPAAAIAPFGQLFSAFDVPRSLDNLRRVLPARGNVGLRLRWEIALNEMEAYACWPTDATNAMIDTWRRGVVDRLESSARFALMPDQAKTNPSIVSFQVRSGDRELGHEELVKLFEVVVTTEHRGLSGGLRRVFIGQPVRYGQRSFIRIALGAPGVRGLLEEGTSDLSDDMRLVEILEDTVGRLFA